MIRRAAVCPETQFGVSVLLIVSHVVHYCHGGRLYAYGPYAREIDVWADLFPRIIIAAPCKTGRPPRDCLALSSNNVSLFPQLETGGVTLRAKLAQLALLPYLLWRLTRAMISADAIHVRCPGNLGLLGAIIAPLFSRHLIAKYAGQWSPYPGEAWTVRLQRAILNSRWWHGPVLVYTDVSSTRPQIIPFFASILTEAQMQRARQAAAARTFGRPLRVAYIGRLSQQKNIDVLLSSIALLRRDGVDVACTIVGDGPQRCALETLASSLGIRAEVRFTGAVEFDHVLDQYEQSDVVVLPSSTEGWPKTIAEAMAFGLVCIGPDRGIVPYMLGEGRGLVVEPGSIGALATALRRIAEGTHAYGDMQHRAAAWAQQFTLERFSHVLHDVLVKHWPDPPQGASIGVIHA